MSEYGKLPVVLGKFNVDIKEMMYYQYLPIKMATEITPTVEERLWPFRVILGTVMCDFVANFGIDRFVASYVYVSAKNLFQPSGKPFNRPGYHCDGFGTDDVNYIWSDRCPTVFQVGSFRISDDESVSMFEMEQQARRDREVRYEHGQLLRLDRYVIHKPETDYDSGLRAFLKVSISKDKYNLEGNSHNYLLDYAWDMKPRQQDRNVPQA